MPVLNILDSSLEFGNRPWWLSFYCEERWFEISEIMLEVSASVVVRKFHTSLRPYQYVVCLLNSLRWVLQAWAVTHEAFRKPMFPQSLSHFAINQYVCSKNKCKFSLKFLKYSGIQERYEKVYSILLLLWISFSHLARSCYFLL